MTEQAQYISGRTVQEQMDNLIKYVDDRSKTVAEEEAQRVLVPAENAKVAAEVAADRAVSSVGQFESRLGGVEDGVAGNRSSIQTIDGEITDIYNDLTNVVRKVGEAGQVVMNGLDLRGTNRTSNTTVGELNNLIVNAKRLIEEIESKLNAYAPMVRTTGNQPSIKGLKGFSNIQTPNVIQRQNNFSTEAGVWTKMLSFPTGTSRNYAFFVHSNQGAWPSIGLLHVENDYGGFPRAYWVFRRWNNENSVLVLPNCVAITADTTPDYYDLWIKGGTNTASIGAFIAVRGTEIIDDIVYPDVKITTTEITDVGATNIYYSSDYPYGGGL